MSNKLKKILENEPTEASAPCRIDMGGTLDIPIFYYPLRHLAPCTFNIAVGLRTRVRLLPYTRDMVKISSSGFESAEFKMGSAPFRHPMGLMFATAAYFQAGGLHIEIDSKSPVRSALGGSSAATVALVAAFLKLMRPASARREPINRRGIALLAYKIEETVAGVPCGIQDQLAAAYGGVNVWHLQADPQKSVFQKKVVIKKSGHEKFARHLLLAYCGIPHESKDINGRWVQQFLEGQNRSRWAEIVDCTSVFVDAIARDDIELAVSSVIREMRIRRELTPDVVDQVGEKLVDAAEDHGCAARFTGAGGGGCIWAVGQPEDIDRLKKVWEETLSQQKNARLLELSIDSNGVVVH
ncbi:MAG: galactokinase [Deltaproteobacteria bacterium]|jgi:D-glycero-alpha-D-manno-heptose-7-phosphate kinase|nr:galactokinase [Deltaproteobacteria bacterium]